MDEQSSEMSISRAVELSTASAVKYSLRRRFVFAISILVAFVLVAQGALLLVLGRRHLKTEVETRAHSYATLAVDPICDAFELYFESGQSKFHEIVDGVQALNSDLDRFAIYDIAGQRLFSSVSAVDPQPVTDLTEDLPAVASGGLLEALRGLEPQVIETLGTGGDPRLILVVPQVEEWGRHQVTVVFLFSYRSLQQAMLEVAWQVAGLALAALGVGVACAFVLSKQSLGPVARLTRGAQNLAEGHLDHRIALRTGDEFEVLGATLDLMAERLADTVADLEGSNESLAALNEELLQVDRVKSDLLANVSHELRTPLTAISGYVEAMAAGMLGELAADQKTSLEVMERNVRRLRGMIDQLLNYSRMESGKLEVELHGFDLESVVEHVVEAVRAAHGGDVDLLVHCPQDLPEVYADGSRIAQVIENLLTNAIKFSTAGTPVELEVREVSEGIELLVQDRGIGIPEELQEKIFERFYQVDATSRRKFGGMGIGLALVREILELNHSRIRVESREGGGTIFRFILPLATERTGLFPRPGWFRVALIDDDTAFVQEVAAHLSGNGFVVETSASAEQGWALVNRIGPDLVVLDRLLPDLDGFDLLRRLQENHRTSNIPVIFATARPERALGLRLGAVDYLVKPLTPQAVEASLRKVLEERNDEVCGAS